MSLIPNAPVSTPSIPRFGSVEGKITSREALLIQVGASWNSLQTPGR
jgi:hypothetical protein